MANTWQEFNQELIELGLTPERASKKFTMYRLFESIFKGTEVSIEDGDYSFTMDADAHDNLQMLLEHVDESLDKDEELET